MVGKRHDKSTSKANTDQTAHMEEETRGVYARRASTSSSVVVVVVVRNVASERLFYGPVLRGVRADFGLFGLSSDWISEKRGVDARASSLPRPAIRTVVLLSLLSPQS